MSVKSVSEQINSFPGWQKTAAIKIRKLIHEAEPDIEEEIKFKNPPYFTYKGNVCALLPTKKHLNVFIYDPIAPDPQKIINQGHNNSTARSIQIFEDDFPDEQAFIDLVRAVVENNKKGGWRKLK